ncbi:MAG TPA: orotidine-5'-phosphate decarboxylase [Acidobacteriaceae bacterium]|jgi:orotidine-5'-phosphate decarboxylase|nr:orotidine-5'-phosphate decarboxylase [Acidobacteriaceae bacterium]
MDSAQADTARLSPPLVNPADRLIVALDLPSATAAFDLVDELQGLCRWFKVGMELYYAAGSSIVTHLRNRGFDVFLDLKLHDIPNTVAGAVRTVSSTGASLLTIHAAGGEKMMRAAALAASRLDAPRLLAVTVLTSMDSADLSAVGIADTPETQVVRLARLAQSAGITGLVCSPQEVTAVRQAVGEDVLLVVPGVRPAGTQGSDDQARVATAAQTIASGASMLVVGRPITQAPDPAKAAVALLAEIAGA